LMSLLPAHSGWAAFLRTRSPLPFRRWLVFLGIFGHPLLSLAF
jgi:hypothetical protein